jgi:hypothetical protein
MLYFPTFFTGGPPEWLSVQGRVLPRSKMVIHPEFYALSAFIADSGN